MTTRFTIKNEGPQDIEVIAADIVEGSRFEQSGREMVRQGESIEKHVWRERDYRISEVKSGE